MRGICPAMIIIPTLCKLILLIAYFGSRDILQPQHTRVANLWMTMVASFIAITGSQVSWFALQRSLLEAEGPDRRLMKP